MYSPTRSRRGAIATSVVAGLCLLGTGLAGGSLMSQSAANRADQARPGAANQQGQPDIGAMLVQGLKATPGCLGTDTAQTSSGKNSIIAWFEDKAAAMRWYESPLHQRMMGGMQDGQRDAPPMAKVPDDIPLMVIATITPSERPEIPGFPGPIKQISIELFTPVPGGASVNGRLSPEAFKVENMKDYTAPAANSGR